MLSVQQFWDCERKRKKIYYCSITELTVLLRVFINKNVWNSHGKKEIIDILDCGNQLLNIGVSLCIPVECCASRDKEIVEHYHLTKTPPEIPIRLIHHSLLYRLDCNRYAYFCKGTCESLFDDYNECAEYCASENDLYFEPERIHNPILALNTFLKTLTRRANETGRPFLLL